MHILLKREQPAFAAAAHTRHAARARRRAPSLGERKGRTRHRRVTTVSSADIFLAPRSARRSDASNAAGRSAGGSRRRQTEPGRLRRPRVQTPAAHAQPGWHRRLSGALRVARTPPPPPRSAWGSAKIENSPNVVPDPSPLIGAIVVYQSLDFSETSSSRIFQNTEGSALCSKTIGITPE